MTTAALIRLAPLLINSPVGDQVRTYVGATGKSTTAVTTTQPAGRIAANGTITTTADNKMPIVTTNTVVTPPAANSDRAKAAALFAVLGQSSNGEIATSNLQINNNSLSSTYQSKSGISGMTKLIIAVVIILVILIIAYIVFLAMKQSRNNFVQTNGSRLNGDNIPGIVPTPDNAESQTYIPDWAYNGQFYIQHNSLGDPALSQALNNVLLFSDEQMATVNIYLVDGGEISPLEFPSSLIIPGAINLNLSYVNVRSDDSITVLSSQANPQEIPIANRGPYPLICPAHNCMGNPSDNRSPFMDSLSQTRDQNYTLMPGTWYKGMGCSLVDGSHPTSGNFTPTSLEISPGRITQLRTCRNFGRNVFNRQTNTYSNLETWTVANSQAEIPSYFINRQLLSPLAVW